MKKALLLFVLVVLFSCSDSANPPLYDDGKSSSGSVNVWCSGPGFCENVKSDMCFKLGGSAVDNCSSDNSSASGGSSSSEAKVFCQIDSVCDLISVGLCNANGGTQVTSCGPSSSGGGSSSSSDDGYVENNTVLFSEVHVANNDYKDEFGNDPGWVEFYNPNAVEVRLRDFELKNNETANFGWKFGDVRIKPNEYFIVFFSGKNYPTFNPNLHASFELKDVGGNLFLFNAKGEKKDQIEYKAGTKDLSWAKKSATEWAFSKPSTPKAANTSAEWYTEIAQPPAADILPKSGHFATSLSITLPNGIYCDKTGAVPTTSNASMQPGTTHNFTSSTILRCIQSASPGAYPSDPIMRTYIVGRLPELPIVSIATDGKCDNKCSGSFEATYESIKNNSSSPDFELPIHVEFFEKGTSGNLPLAWSHPAELGPMGAASRQWPKKSVSVSFKEKYGVKNIQYRLFPDAPAPKVLKYKHFVLRNNGNNYENNDYIRDMLMTSLTEGMDIDYQKGRAVVVYYNGKYYGIHNLRERSNSDYFETNYDINENNVNLAKINYKAPGGIEVSRGSADDYASIINWVSGNTMTDDNVKLLRDRIDVDNFTNHFQSRIFYNDADWPGNNIKVWNSTASGQQKWRYFMYDTDHGFGSWGSSCAGSSLEMLEMVTKNAYSKNCNGEQNWPNPPNSTVIMRKLLENEKYKNAFINRFSFLLATYFDPTRTRARIDLLRGVTDSERSYDRERWPGSANNLPFETITDFAKDRPASMQKAITQRFGLYEPVDITINGYTHVDGLPIPSFKGNSVTFKAYPGVPMVLKWDGGEKTINVTSGGGTFTAGQ